MYLRSRLLRALAAFAASMTIGLATFGVLVRLLLWLMGRSTPWEQRSSEQHTTALMVELGAMLLTLAVTAALTRILYLSWTERAAATTAGRGSARGARSARPAGPG